MFRLLMSLPRANVVIAAVAAAAGAASGSPALVATGAPVPQYPVHQLTTAPRIVDVSTEAGLQSALSSATPGTTIRLAGGTYSGQILIKGRSGTAAQPIVVEPASSSPVILTASLPMPSCGASGPDGNLTLKVRDGASYWTFSGLHIDGGVDINGAGASDAHTYFRNLIRDHNWKARRAVPGRGTRDPAAAKNLVSYLSQQIHKPLAAADGVRLIHDTFTRKGIHVTLARYGTIADSTISNIACGVGPGIWFGTYSDGWTIERNTVSNIASSTHSHYMQEGIRIDGASNYNLITDNLVEDLPGDGRAFTTDQDASYNTIEQNTATNVSVGFNDEMSGWGNNWLDNGVSGFRSAGFAFRLADGSLAQPSMDTSTNAAVVRCNLASGTGDDLAIGASMNSAFSGNAFRSVQVGKHVPSYWVSQGNTWDGMKVLPPKNPQDKLGDC